MTQKELPELQFYQIDINNIDIIDAILMPDTVEKIKAQDAFGLIAVENDNICGCICGQYVEENAALDIIDIIVLEDYRRKKIGTTLAAEFIDRICEIGIVPVEFITVSFIDKENCTEEFYKSLGFEIQKNENAKVITYTLKDILDSYIMSLNIPKKNYTIKTYNEIGNIEYRKIISKVEEANGNYDYEFAKDADKNLSFAMYLGNDLETLVEVIKEPDGSITLGQYFILKKTTGDLYALQVLGEKLLKEFNEETLFKINITSKSSEKFTRKLFGRKGKEQVLCNGYLSLIESGEIL